MARFLSLMCALAWVLMPALASAQTLKLTKRDSANALAITGLASSARHCISGTSSNVHGLGFIDRDSRVTVTFHSDFDPIAGIVTLAIDTAEGRAAYTVDDDSGGNLEPLVQYTASISGNAALYVSGFRSTSGCYWYKLEVVPPTTSIAAAERLPKPAIARPAAVAGLASTAYHCIAGQYVANIHSIGRVSAGQRVTITFDTDFDAMAGMTNMDLFAASPQALYLVDDDSGGGLVPELRFTASTSGTVTLFVGGYEAVAGCYRYKVEIQ